MVENLSQKNTYTYSIKPLKRLSSASGRNKVLQARDIQRKKQFFASILITLGYTMIVIATLLLIGYVVNLSK